MSDILVPCERCGEIQRLDVEGPRVIPEKCHACGNPNNPPKRPDWLWTGEAIDRIYSASNMLDALNALDEIRAYTTFLEKQGEGGYTTEPPPDYDPANDPCLECGPEDTLFCDQCEVTKPPEEPREGDSPSEVAGEGK